MKRSDKIRALSRLGSGEISLETFREMAEVKDSIYTFKYMPQEMMSRFVECRGCPEEELTVEEQIVRMGDDLLFAVADCIQHQHPKSTYRCDNMYYNPEDTNCRACDDERRLRNAESFT